MSARVHVQELFKEDKDFYRPNGKFVLVWKLVFCPFKPFSVTDARSAHSMALKSLFKSHTTDK